MHPANPTQGTGTARKRTRKRKRRQASSSSSSSSSSDSESQRAPSPKPPPKAPSAAESSSSSSSSSESESDTRVKKPQALKAPQVSDPSHPKTQSRQNPSRSPSLSPSPPPSAIPPFLPEPKSEEYAAKQAEMKDRFRTFWMASIADGFRDDLDKIRQEPNMTKTRLTMLIDSLASGSEVFQSKGGVDEMELVLE